jgi:hypothetical protein
MLVDPEFVLAERERKLLEQCVHASLLRTRSPLTVGQRVKLSDELATAATWALLRQLPLRATIS